MTNHYDVIIVGGGITGLAAAHRLATTARQLRVRLLERDHRLGGKIATERVDGFVIEGGPDCFLAMKPAGKELCRQVGLKQALRGTDPTNRRSYIKRRAALNQLPAGLTGLVPSRIGPLLTTKTLSLAGRLRCGLEYFVPRRQDGADETIAEFTTRRFGREAYEWLVEPLMAGIHAGDGEQLSLAATFPQLRQIEHDSGSLLRTMLTRRPQRSTGAPGSAFLTPEGGLIDIVEALTRTMTDVEITTGTPVHAVTNSEDGFHLNLANGTTIAAPNVILATPAFVTGELLRRASEALSDTLLAIPFVSTAIVTLAYDAKQVTRPLNGSGYVNPRAEGGPVVACSWTSSKFTHRAPDGRVLLRLFIGRAGHDEIVSQPDDALLDLARQEVAETVGAKGEPLLSRIARWANGLPQYTRGHLDRVKRIETELTNHVGLELAGASYKGVGIPDCIQSGWDAADRIISRSKA